MRGPGFQPWKTGPRTPCFQTALSRSGAATAAGPDLARCCPGKEPRGFAAHHLIAFAGHPLELVTVEHLDVPAPVADDSEFLKLAGSLGDAFAPHPEHVGDQLLRHLDLGRREPIDPGQDPTARRLAPALLPLPYRRLG